MYRLSIVRHAKSSWDHPGIGDFERPLNERGRRDLPVMAKAAARRLPPSDRLVSSPALRAATTARGFAGGLGVADTEIVFDARIYDAELDTLLVVVRGLNDDDGHVMLFGHNPGFSELALTLAPSCPFAEMPTCAIALLELDIKGWRDAAPGCARLKDYLHPRNAS